MINNITKNKNNEANSNDKNNTKSNIDNLTNAQPDNCNCRDKLKCPLANKCLTENIIYEARITTQNSLFKYIGSTSNSFKKRWYNHTRSFRDPGLKKATSLAKLIHNLKDKKTKFDLTWRIIKKANPYSGGGAKCNLCLCEAYLIMKGAPGLINLHAESILKCTHRKKWSFMIKS